jgi:hypothetical protein
MNLEEAAPRLTPITDPKIRRKIRKMNPRWGRFRNKLVTMPASDLRRMGFQRIPKNES